LGVGGDCGMLPAVVQEALYFGGFYSVVRGEIMKICLDGRDRKTGGWYYV